MTAPTSGATGFRLADRSSRSAHRSAEPRRNPGGVAPVWTGWVGRAWSSQGGTATAAWHDQVMPSLGPRIVVAGTHSGVGKTTVATGLLAALRAAGHRVRVGEGRARLHRSRLPRPRHRGPAAQPRPVAVRGRGHRSARRPRRRRRRRARDRRRDGPVRRCRRRLRVVDRRRGPRARCAGAARGRRIGDGRVGGGGGARLRHARSPRCDVAGVVLNRVGVGRSRGDAPRGAGGPAACPSSASCVATTGWCGATATSGWCPSPRRLSVVGRHARRARRGDRRRMRPRRRHADRPRSRPR